MSTITRDELVTLGALAFELALRYSPGDVSGEKLHAKADAILQALLAWAGAADTSNAHVARASPGSGTGEVIAFPVRNRASSEAARHSRDLGKKSKARHKQRKTQQGGASSTTRRQGNQGDSSEFDFCDDDALCCSDCPLRKE
ncbi:MAG: hypothetical protein ACLPN5_21660 [Roseiarcus sp.]